MEAWLWIVIGVCSFIIVLLMIKVFLLQESAKEIRKAFSERIAGETNTLIDISSRDRHMCELADCLNEQLRILREKRLRFELGDRRLQEAVTNLSHDLRTPLTAVCGYLDLLEEEDKSLDAERYLGIIRNRIEVLRLNMEELFHYTYLTSGEEISRKEELGLGRELEESLSAFYAVIQERGIEPKISIPEQEVFRKLDRALLNRIFENILSNAIKYSDGDLEVSLFLDGTITFSNHAAALDEVEVGKLFHRFYTVETARKSTGLGLAIARELTLQQGGNIDATYQKRKLVITLSF